MKNARGFILVNALVLVAALSAVAVFLLTRAEQGRARLSLGISASQLVLGLDAAEALALTQLRFDSNSLDHLGEAWAKPNQDLPLGNVQLSSQISDLQGLFNVNWLSNRENLVAQQAFDRLMHGLGISETSATAIKAAVRPGIPANIDAYKRLDPPQNPVGGALLLIQQLNQIPGLSAKTLARIQPFLTALPGDSKLNVNTAKPQVLAAFLPQLSTPKRAQLLALRQRTPFVSVAEFTEQVQLNQDPEDEDEPADPEVLQAEQLSVSSTWFQLDSQVIPANRASPDAAEMTRVSVLQRLGLPAYPSVAWRLTRYQ